jgi:hypothetical protein
MAGTAAFKSFFKSHSLSSPRLWLIRDARPFESTKFPVSIALMVLDEQPTNLELPGLQLNAVLRKNKPVLLI